MTYKIFIKQIKTLLDNQDPCIINGGNTFKFKLDKEARQGDPISVYLFILVLKIVFNLIKENKGIQGLTFFDHTFCTQLMLMILPFLKGQIIYKRGN